MTPQEADKILERCRRALIAAESTVSELKTVVQQLERPAEPPA
jgi:hypothetical protein